MKQIKETYEINKNGLLGTDVHRDAERRKAPFAAIDWFCITKLEKSLDANDCFYYTVTDSPDKIKINNADSHLKFF